MQFHQLLARIPPLLCMSAAVFAGALDHWHSRTNFQLTTIQDIAYGAGAWVVVDWPKGIVTATNLVSPGTFLRTLVEAQPYAVEYGAGRFVLVCKGGIMNSTDGTNWTTPSALSGLRSLLFANGRFVAVGSTAVASSGDGINWDVKTVPGAYMSEIAYGNGIFVAGGGLTNAISSDGVNWNAVPTGVNAAFYTIGFGAGRFVGISIRNEIWISTDARSWTANGKLDVLRPGRIAWGNGYFVTAGGGARAYSRDGITWKVLTSGTTEYNVEFINGRFFATGYQTIFESDPVISMAVLSPTRIELSGMPGAKYELEVADDIAAPKWERHSALQLPLTSTSAVFVNDLDRSVRARFFRVALPQ